MKKNSTSKIQLQYPFDEKQIRALRIGNVVSISGLIHTGRDRFHKYLFENGDCPVDLRNGAIYHCGPVIVRNGKQWSIRAAGPTTSIREEPYMADIIAKFGLRLIIGKGGMGKRTKAACRDCGCVYLQAVGGAATLLAARIRMVTAVHFLAEFGAAEAVWSLEAENFEAVVGIDAEGNSLYDEIEKHARSVWHEIVLT